MRGVALVRGSVLYTYFRKMYIYGKLMARGDVDSRNVQLSISIEALAVVMRCAVCVLVAHSGELSGIGLARHPFHP